MKWIMGDRRGGVCHGLAWWVIAGAVVAIGAERPAGPDQASDQEPAGAQDAAEADRRARLEQEAEQAKLKREEEQARQEARRQQIAAQANHFQQMIAPSLVAELELVRKTCGSLPSDARKKIVKAGNDAVQAVAKQVAERQMGGDGRAIDTRKMIRDAVAAAVKPHATAEEFAAYEREQAARVARRNRVARLMIVNKVDGEIQLSQAQREKIEADLENRWDAKWLQGLHDTGGMIINNRPPAPDFADKCIAPHLDERQRAEWKTWCGQAGWSRHGNHYGWDFDGQGMQLDPWWSR